MIPEPHGGRLVHRTLSPSDRERCSSELANLPTLHLGLDQLYDLEKIAIGAYSPLDGFMDSATLESVLSSGRLSSGLPWSIPILLPIPANGDRAVAERLRRGDEVALVDAAGELRGMLDFEERFSYDPAQLAQSTFGTVDPAHPNVREVLASGGLAVAGQVSGVPPPTTSRGMHELTPDESRELFRARGWDDVAAYQCRNPPHTAHEYLQRVTLEREDVDALFIHPVVGRLKAGDYRPEVIVRAYEALARSYCAADRVVLSPLTISMRYAGPKAALFLAIVRKNYGCSRYIVGRDQAGVGRYYDPYACHRIFDAFDVGITPLRYEEAFYCRACRATATAKTCPHPADQRVDTSQTRIRDALRSGGEIPPELLRPEVAAILREPNVLLKDGET